MSHATSADVTTGCDMDIHESHLHGAQFVRNVANCQYDSDNQIDNGTNISQFKARRRGVGTVTLEVHIHAWKTGYVLTRVSWLPSIVPSLTTRG